MAPKKSAKSKKKATNPAAKNKNKGGRTKSSTDSIEKSKRSKTRDDPKAAKKPKTGSVNSGDKNVAKVSNSNDRIPIQNTLINAPPVVVDRLPVLGNESHDKVGGLVCVVCHDADTLRLRLRVCHHVVCVACLLGHLQAKGQIQLKARVGIRCPMLTCAREIHKNDINAVLDEEEDGLDKFMELEQRQWLQYVHNKDGIILALAGSNPENQRKLVKRCPMCKSIYLQRDGCNNVICANLRCRTQFCWECERPIRGIGHFTGGSGCHVSFDDIERGMLVFRMAREVRTFGVAFGIPVVFLFLVFLFPIILMVMLPITLAFHVYDKATSKTNFLTPAESVLLGLKLATVILLSIPVSILLGICSIPSGWGIFCLYLLFFFLKLTAITNKLFDKYDSFLPFAKMLGLLHYKQMLKDARESRMIQKEIEEEEKEREQVEQGKIEIYDPANMIQSS